MPKMSEMRQYIMDLYPEKIWWHEKVQKMPTKQVVAIYNSYKNKRPRKSSESNSYHQIDMFEYMASLTQNNTEVNV